MSPTSAELVVVVALFVRAGCEEAFSDFERQALAILRDHGGRLERAIRPPRDGGDERTPFEIHVLVLPSRTAFEAYRHDPRLAALAALRARAIDDTALWSGPDVSVEYTAG